MSGPYRRKRTPKGNLEISKKYRTRRRTKDLDQIHQDMANPQAAALQLDPDMPGGGHHYCLHCARYFVDDPTLQAHFKTKLHRKRMKNLAEAPYTIEESMAAGGLSSNSFYSLKMK